MSTITLGTLEILINILVSKWKDEKAGRGRRTCFQRKVGNSCFVLWILRCPLAPAHQWRNVGSQRVPYEDAVKTSEEVSLK